MHAKLQFRTAVALLASAATGAMIAASAPAAAQSRTPQSSPPGPTLPQHPTAPPDTTPPGTVPGQDAPSGSSSQDLSHSGGVIKPPAQGVDPEMAQPTPSPGSHSMPVIPPPGAPGGNPNVKPK